MKHKYILMCALAMTSIATQAQDEVYYDISNTPATEVVEGHIYLLANRANPEMGLAYDENGATVFEPVSEQLGQSVTSDHPFLFTATADGFMLPVTLENINDVFEDWGYGDTSGGTVLSRPSYATATDETVYFAVKDASGQYVIRYNGRLYGVNATTPAPEAQWIAYEVTEHEHQWEYSDSNVHFCTCGEYADHELDGCNCTVCQSEVHEFDYENYPLTCTRCGESCHHPRIDYIEAKEPNCYADGWKEHYVCHVCGDVFKDEAGTTKTSVEAETLEQKDHSYTGEYKFNEETKDFETYKGIGTEVETIPTTDLTAEQQKQAAITKAESELEVAKIEAEKKITEANADAERQLILAEAAARSATTKIIELARTLGYEIKEEVTERGTNYTIIIPEGDEEEFNTMVLEYLEYLAYLEKWNGVLPEVVASDGAISIMVAGSTK